MVAGYGAVCSTPAVAVSLFGEHVVGAIILSIDGCVGCGFIWFAHR